MKRNWWKVLIVPAVLWMLRDLLLLVLPTDGWRDRVREGQDRIDEEAEKKLDDIEHGYAEELRELQNKNTLVLDEFELKQARQAEELNDDLEGVNRWLRNLVD